MHENVGMTPALTTYLRLHQAGAEAMVALIDRLPDLEPARRDWFLRLRAEIVADRATLTEIARRLEPLAPDEATTAPENGDRPLRLTAALEDLTLGILGKHKLWVVLTALADDYPPLRNVDLDRLRARAVEQHAQIEQERIAAAGIALRPRRRSA